MVHRCFVGNCPNKKVTGSGIHFFSFPKDDDLKKLWLKSIKLKYGVQTQHSRVCSDHFTKNDFKTIVGGRNHILLKNDAVPTIFIAKRTTEKINDGIRIASNENPTSSHAIDTNIQLVDSAMLLEENSIDVQHEDAHIVEKSEVATCKRPKRKLTYGLVETENNISPSRSSYTLPKRGRPTTKSPATPRKTLIKSKVKILQQKVRRLKTKIKTLNDVLEELKKKGLIENDPCDLIENEFEGIQLEILKNELTNKKRKPTGCRYSDEIKKFALTLHYYSPKAYKFYQLVPTNI
ncbi:THAP domain-containing protein 2-like [Acyrthosiphon pisum]|uniref:THAP-type domain-containing protein n=1 Tax=Acyrthosiphon pisum TaxID=7029 RepID=A0A8R2AF53_ACYPI|nr:THAP domain-containing protein 2-like [Acyrthosiphon pisum]|eukprot:XP_003240448.1 PREDICTED: THAP domain-containing protein 2-like [Acyrthosiphon pisum]